MTHKTKLLHAKKIAIIGCSGSGKTTLAFKLHKKLQLPIVHLDQHYWKPGWQRSTLLDFHQKHEELCEQDTWIMDGIYMNTVHLRILHADVIIFLDIPRRICLWRTIKRTFTHYGKVIPGNPEECPQRIDTNYFKFLQWIWSFENRYRSNILSMLDMVKNDKQIYHIQSKKELTHILE